MRVDACPEPSQNKGNELLHQIGAESGALVSGAFWPEPLQNRSKSVGFYSVQERFGVPLWGR